MVQDKSEGRVRKAFDWIIVNREKIAASARF